MMRESTIEDYGRRLITARGGQMLKWSSPGLRGVPDNIVFWAGGHVHFIECKATDGAERAQQTMVRERIAALGAICFLVRSKQDFDDYVRVYAPRAA